MSHRRHREAAEDPQPHEHDQRQTCKPAGAGPARHRRQQESRGSRENESIEQLVRVPVQRRQRTERHGVMRKEVEPYRHDRERVQAGEQEEGAKAVIKDCNAARETIVRLRADQGGPVNLVSEDDRVRLVFPSTFLAGSFGRTGSVVVAAGSIR
jgi:hypothetical protein